MSGRGWPTSSRRPARASSIRLSGEECRGDRPRIAVDTPVAPRGAHRGHQHPFDRWWTSTRRSSGDGGGRQRAGVHERVAFCGQDRATATWGSVTWMTRQFASTLGSKEFRRARFRCCSTTRRETPESMYRWCCCVFRGRALRRRLRQQLRANGEMVMREGLKSMRQSLTALSTTLLMILPVPALHGFFAWRLRVARGADAYTEALASAPSRRRRTSSCSMAFTRCARQRGLPQAYFGWAADRLRIVTHNLRSVHPRLVVGYWA